MKAHTKTHTHEEAARALSELKALVEELYVHEPCGGPLHIVTDDGNVRDCDLVFCYRWLYEQQEDVAVYTRYLCMAILHDLMLMDEAQRTIWWLATDISLEDLDPKSLLVRVRGCQVEHQRNGIYDDVLVRYGRAGEKPVVVWEGLEQLRERKKAQSS
jgi:hypothetical protein